MITGAHSVLFSTDPEADRAFLRDVLGLPFVDVGEGWLIFGLPPAEVAVHPSEADDHHAFFFMCDDIEGFSHRMAAHDVPCSEVDDQGFGLMVYVTLPGGGRLGVYQPRHPRPDPMVTPA